MSNGMNQMVAGNIKTGPTHTYMQLIVGCGHSQVLASNPSGVSTYGRSKESAQEPTDGTALGSRVGAAACGQDVGIPSYVPGDLTSLCSSFAVTLHIFIGLFSLHWGYCYLY